MNAIWNEHQFNSKHETHFTIAWINRNTFLCFFIFFFCRQIGNASLKNRTFTDTNDASFDSSYSAYLQETKQQLAKVTQPPLNLSQSLSNIVDVSGLSLAKDKYFERPSMVRNDYFCTFFFGFFTFFLWFKFQCEFRFRQSFKNTFFSVFFLNLFLWKFHKIDSIRVFFSKLKISFFRPFLILKFIKVEKQVKISCELDYLKS